MNLLGNALVAANDESSSDCAFRSCYGNRRGLVGSI